MNLSATSQLPVSAQAKRVPTRIAAQAMVTCRRRREGVGPKSANSPSDKSCPLADPPTVGGGEVCRSLAKREASAVFAHSATVETTKTPRKRNALARKMVQNTSKYPMAENHSQSTKKSLASPSAMRQARMKMTAAATLRHRMGNLLSPDHKQRRAGSVSKSHSNLSKAAEE